MQSHDPNPQRSSSWPIVFAHVRACFVPSASSCQTQAKDSLLPHFIRPPPSLHQLFYPVGPCVLSEPRSPLWGWPVKVSYGASPFSFRAAGSWRATTGSEATKAGSIERKFCSALSQEEVKRCPRKCFAAQKKLKSSSPAAAPSSRTFIFFVQNQCHQAYLGRVAYFKILKRKQQQYASLVHPLLSVTVNYSGPCRPFPSSFLQWKGVSIRTE